MSQNISFMKQMQFIIFAITGLLTIPAGVSAQLIVNDIYPPAGIVDQEFEITVEGSGFSENTKVYVEYDGEGQDSVVGFMETPGTAYGICVAEDIVYIADAYAGLQIVDASDPASPIIIGNVNTPGVAYEVIVQDGIAYVADLWGGLQIIDVAFPSEPRLIQSLNTLDYAYDVAVKENIAYIADGEGGLVIADISNLNQPEIIAVFETDFAADLDIVNNLVFVGGGYEGIRIIDVAVPTIPRLVNTWGTKVFTSDLQVKNDIMYFVEDFQMTGLLHLIDIGNPEMLAEMQSVFIPGSPWRMEVLPDIIRITMGTSGIETKGGTDNGGIRKISITDLPGFAYDIASSNGIAYVTSTGGLTVVSAPFLIDQSNIVFNDQTLHVSVPGLALNGNYTLHFVDDLYSLTKHNAVSISDTVPKIASFPSRIDFGRTELSECYDSYRSVVISNMSEEDITIENLYIESAYDENFTISDNFCSGRILKPDEQCTFNIAFTPEYLGKSSTSISMYAVGEQGTVPFITEIQVSGESYEKEIYRFERMLPVLKQPWYFDGIADIAVDPNDYVYITDNLNHKIIKFTRTGQFITQAGMSSGYDFIPAAIEFDSDENIYVTDVEYNYFYKFSSVGDLLFKAGGNGNGQVNYPSGIASRNGSIYISEFLNHRIQQFDSEGNYVRQWGGLGGGDGEFNMPVDIALDSKGFVYVSDTENNRIQKFDPSGVFIKAWGEAGTGESEFNKPFGITVDDNDVVYVSDKMNDRIQMFSSDGDFIGMFGSYGWGTGQLAGPEGIAVGSGGNIYVVDEQRRVQIFEPNGELVDEWAYVSDRPKKFRLPAGIAMDDAGFFYVADRNNDRIQKFTADGCFVKEWGSYGMGDGEFDFPEGIAIDGSGFVYVSEKGNNRIQKFTADGVFVSKWGGPGEEPGEFDRPTDLAIDQNDHIYVSDSKNNRIQKFTSKGVFILQFGSFGNGSGEFYSPMGIATDNVNNVYVSDYGNHRIQKFNSSGEFITQWDEDLETGYFMPDGISVDDQNYVYVADAYTCAIRKYTSDGVFAGSFGEFGYGVGQFNSPKRLCVDGDGKVYVTDENSRVQVFKKINLTEKETKAIIVAGRDSKGDGLWPATQMCANFAYESLVYQGFTKENIHYLSSDTDLDLDFNGESDEVDGLPTAANLEDAITQWAKDADSLVVYLVDHGGKDATFRMNENDDSLSAVSLDSWLDTAQEDIPGEVIVIYDGCYSGSFIPSLTPPEGRRRFVITSASAEEEAKFVSQGTISFSFNFWNHVFSGLDLRDSFNAAVDTINHRLKDQTPMIDSDGDGEANETEDYEESAHIYIGNGTDYEVEEGAPVIQSVFPFSDSSYTISGTSSCKIKAYHVTDPDGIVRVWAVIRPPNFSPGETDGIGTVLDLPTLDLVDPAGNGNYESEYNRFHSAGTYQIAVYAMDGNGNICVPKLTNISVDNPLSRRAVILAGGSAEDPLWPAIEKNVKTAYSALDFQGFQADDIYLMSPATIPGVNKLPLYPNRENLEDALTRWAADNTQDLVLYIIGKGNDSVFQMNSDDDGILTASQLDEWLDTLQNGIFGEVLVVYDSCKSGSFIPALIPPAGKKRIVISSVAEDQPACFLSEGNISFSKYFWYNVLKGANADKAFKDARNALSWGRVIEQTPLINDNGNGIGNEKADGDLAERFIIGNGIMVAGEEPIIGTVSELEPLNGEISVEIRVDHVIATAPLVKMWVVVIPPVTLSNSCEIPQYSFELLPDGTGAYATVCSGFSQMGDYTILIYASDISGNVSEPIITKIVQEMNVTGTKGDINGDGDADLADAVIALKTLTASDEDVEIRWDYPDSGADVDGNKTVEMNEAIYLLQLMAELH